jgi:hypothetical protein
MTRRQPITAADLMDAAEVCEHFGCAPSSLRVAMSQPEKNPRLGRLVPKPLRKVGGQWVWRRTDVEGAGA